MKRIVIGLMLVLIPAMLWAAYPLTFNGVFQVDGTYATPDGATLYMYHNGVFVDSIENVQDSSTGANGHYTCRLQTDSAGQWFGEFVFWQATNALAIIHYDDPYVKDTSFAASSSGSGAYTCSLFVRDTVNSQWCQDVVVTLNDSAETGTPLTQTTDANGRTAFFKSNGAYVGIAAGGVYTFASEYFRVNSASRKDTIKGGRAVITAPSSASLCRVYAYLIGADGVALQGATCTFSLTVPVATDTNVNRAVMSLTDLKATTNSLGYVYKDIVKNQDLLPLNSWWTVTVKHSRMSTPWTRSFYLPSDSTTFDFGKASSDAEWSPPNK